MVFGDKKIFAVEAILTQQDEYAFISYCFWVMSNRIGDISKSSVLSGQIPILENIFEGKGKRNATNLENINIEKALDFFIKNIWEGDNLIELVNHGNLKIFDINSNEGEGFDGYYVFLIEYSSYDLLLYRDAIENKDHRVKIPKGIFYYQIKELLNWIQRATYITVRLEFRDVQ